MKTHSNKIIWGIFWKATLLSWIVSFIIILIVIAIILFVFIYPNLDLYLYLSQYPDSASLLNELLIRIGFPILAVGFTNSILLLITRYLFIRFFWRRSLKKGKIIIDSDSDKQFFWRRSLKREKVIIAGDSDKQLQTQPLQPVYAVVYTDSITISVKREDITQIKNVFGVMGIDIDGKKECLGLYITSEDESSHFWLSVLNDLKSRGMKYMAICTVENLNAASDAIRSMFPHTDIQKSVVHQIWNSMKHVSLKDKIEVTKDLMSVYTAIDEPAGLKNLETFEAKWNSRYEYIGKSWRKNWDELAKIFKYIKEIRKLMYSDSLIKSLNSSLNSASKKKGVFLSDESALKILYSEAMNVQNQLMWRIPIQSWGVIYSQLMNIHGDNIENA